MDLIWIDYNIFASTLASSINSKFPKHFNVCIIDESANATFLSSLIPLSVYEIDKVVLCGDHKQLPPVVKFNNRSINSELKYDKSFFEHCLNKFKSRMIRKQ